MPPNDILVYSDTPIVVADLADYAGDLGVRTDQIDLTSIASGAAQESDKVDLGEKRAVVFTVTAAIEFNVAPASGRIVSIWWAPSPNVGAAVANPGGVVGADGGYTGTAGDSLADSIKQCTLIFNLIATSDVAPVVEFQTKIFSPLHRYGTLVVFNETDQAFEGDAIEMGVSFTPIIDEVQA